MVRTRSVLAVSPAHGVPRSDARATTGWAWFSASRKNIQLAALADFTAKNQRTAIQAEGRFEIALAGWRVVRRVAGPLATGSISRPSA